MYPVICKGNPRKLSFIVLDKKKKARKQISKKEIFLPDEENEKFVIQGNSGSIYVHSYVHAVEYLAV